VPVVTSSPAAVSDAPPEPERKGVVGAVLKGFDALNKTYTVGGEQSTRPSTSNDALATGQPAGEVTVINLKPAEPQPAAGAAATTAAAGDAGAKTNAAPAAATDEAGQPKEKAGFLDFLNKTYTIGGKSKPAADATTTATPATAAPAARPEAANPAPAAASSEKGFWQGIVDFFSTEHTLSLPSATSAPASESGAPKLKATLEYPDAAESAKPRTDAKAPSPAPAN
jgi:hypothetical protein